MNPKNLLQQRRKLRKGVYLIPSLFTTANVFAGFYAIISSLKAMEVLGAGAPDAAAHAAALFDGAAKGIGWAILLDALDGRVARLANAASDFGVEFDSLADVLSFGIAPAVLAFAWGYGGVPQLAKVAWFASFIYLICGALRLARFNVGAHKPQKPTEVNPAKLDKKQFVGLPIPAAAGLIAAIVHFSPMPVSLIDRTAQIGSWTQSVSNVSFGTFMIILVIALGGMMVSNIRHSSFKGSGPHTRNPRLIIILLTVMFAGVWFYSQWALLILGILYCVHGIAGKLWSLARRRPAAATADQAEINAEHHYPVK